MTTAIILDTETTTNKETPERPLEVVELAWMWLAEPSGTYFRYKPTMPPTFGATAVHHILMSELEGCPPAAQAPQDVPPADFWIGHNIDFDWKALGQPPVRRICTLAMSRHLWPECDSHTLSAMMYFTQGCTPETRERLRDAHSALSDCEFVLDLLGVIQTVTKINDLEALWAFSEEARIPRTWPNGKFAGQPIGAADRGYASWCARQPGYDPYILTALRREGLLR